MPPRLNWFSDRRKLRSTERTRPTFQEGRLKRRLPILGRPARKRRSRYIQPDRCRAFLRFRTLGHPSWGECNPPGKRPHTPRLLCRYRVLLLRKPYWGQLNFLGKGTTFIPQPAEPVQFLVGTGRFELPTCRLGGDRSIQLSYVPALLRSNCLDCSRGPAL